jgi:hypothetical protein
MIKELEKQYNYLKENGQEFIDNWVLRLNKRIESKGDRIAMDGEKTMKETLIELRQAILDDPEKFIEEELKNRQANIDQLKEEE